MDTDDPKNWRIEDRFPKTEISSILPLSERLHSIYARIEDKSHIAPTPMNVFAVVLMVKGLEYHYENFKRLVVGVTFPPSGMCSDADTALIEQAKLEVIAYINTIGQLYYWAEDYRETSAPTIIRITESFRHKYTAHVSTHKKKKSDSDIERALHLFAFAGGSLWDGDGNLLLQIQKNQGEAINFNLVAEHSVIMEEVQAVFEEFTRPLH